MKEVINQILDKFSPYQLFCNLFPGYLVIRGFCYLTSTTLATENICEVLALSYFYGVAVSRIASTIVAPVLKWVLKIKFAPYTKFLDAMSLDMSLGDLVREANMFRALLTSILILLVVWMLNFIPFMRSHWSSPHCFILFHALVLVPVLALSYRKQSEFVVGRIEKNAHKGED